MERPVIYDKVEAAVGTLTAEMAKTFLGWEEPGPSVDWGAEFLFRDRTGKLDANGQRLPGKKIRCHQNNHNRPFNQTLALQWMYEILQGNWRLNGEAMIIGKTGLCLDCQHRMIGLVWATQEWANDVAEAAEGQVARRFPNWETEPTVDCVIVTGIDEDRDTVNTINTGKPRDLTDALFASGVFGQMDSTSPADRKKLKELCKMLSGCLKLLCLRTGADVDAFAPRRTHAESLDFLDRHPRAMEAVKHIYEEDGSKGQVSRYLSPGYAAAMLYLMGSSDTRREDPVTAKGYSDILNLGGRPSEEQLTFGHWDRACQFWTDLAKTAEDGRARTNGPLRELVEALGDVSQYSTGGHLADDLACICRAWQRYAVKKPVRAEDFEFSWAGEGRALNGTPKQFLALEPDDRLGLSLTETPTVSGDPDLGIDQGDPAKAE